MGKTFPTEADMDALSKSCEKLSTFKANILRTTSFGSVEWSKEDAKWKGGVVEGKGISKSDERQMASGTIEGEVR